MIYTVRNWNNFQHYKDRNPPWIKLHFSLLSSADWVTLDDASRVLAVACMLVASRNEGKIDGSDKGLTYLQRVAYLNKKPNLKPLIDCGFLESASAMLADASTKQANASLYTETYKPTEKHIAQSDDKPIAPRSTDTPAKPNGKIVHELGPLNDGTSFPVTESQLHFWRQTYPAADIPAELLRMNAWLDSHPSQRKTQKGAKRFVTSWLDRVQNRPPPQGVKPAAQPWKGAL